MESAMTLRRLGTLAVAAVIVAAVGWRLLEAPRRADAAGPAPQSQIPVTTATARRQDVPVFLDGLGTVQAFNVVQIKAQVNGTLVALPAHEGQEVHKGDIIAEIDPRPYQAALDQATAQRAEDLAQLQSAQADLKRYQDLAKRSFAPVQQVDDQQAIVNKDIAAIAADTAAMETARINLGFCVIRAPIDGRVSLYQIDAGNLIEVATQSAIVTITQDKPISVVFTLPEGDLVRVQEARAKGTLPVIVASNDDQRQLAQGTLLTPNNTIDTTSGTISLKANFANEDDHLWPGQFVNTRVRVNVLRNAVTVPDAAIEHGPDGLFVYVVKPDQSVAQVGIQVGYDDNGRSVVTKGLSGTETVVVSGQSRLAPGTHVKATDASKAPPQGQDEATDDTSSPG
jgi:multidrug efflux system membrane fusion protein